MVIDGGEKEHNNENKNCLRVGWSFNGNRWLWKGGIKQLKQKLMEWGVF